VVLHNSGPSRYNGSHIGVLDVLEGRARSDQRIWETASKGDFLAVVDKTVDAGYPGSAIEHKRGLKQEEHDQIGRGNSRC